MFKVTDHRHEDNRDKKSRWENSAQESVDLMLNV